MASPYNCLWHKSYGEIEQYTIEVYIGKWASGMHYIEVWLHITDYSCNEINDVYWYAEQLTAFDCANLSATPPLDSDDSPVGCYGGSVLVES